MAQQNVQTYIAEGFLEDCEELIYKLTHKFEKVDWHKFCYCWKQMEFDMLFYGRQSGAEVVELTEELLQTARLYIVSKTDNFESQVVGLFIAYAITIIQPYKNLCALRLVPRDVPALKKIEFVARRDNRRDILMILGQLYVSGKTQFHVALREQAMDISIRKYFDGSTNVPRDIARRWHGRLDRHRVNAMDDIAQIEAKYAELKMNAKSYTESQYPDLKVKVDIFKPQGRHIADSLRKLISGESTQAEEVKHVSTVRARAMRNVVDPMKHLHGLTARQNANAKKADAPECSSKPKSKARSKCDKKPSAPNHTEGPCLGFSLPSLSDPPDGTVQGSRGSSPETPFRGFKPNKDMTADDNTTSKVHKGKGVGKSSTNLQAGTSVSPAVQRTYHRSPNSVSKRKNSNNEDSKKKKRKYKNILNKKLKLNNDFNSDESNSDKSGNSDNTSDDSSEPCEAVPSTSCKGTPLTIQSKGVVKHFMQYEVSNIVIRTEEMTPPNIEIEYIDNYKGANAYEEMCEVSDDEEIKNEVNKRMELEKGLFEIEPVGGTSKADEVEFTIEECDEFGSTKDIVNNVQSFTETGDEGPCHSNNIDNVPKQNDIDMRHFVSMNTPSPADQDTVKKILSKNQTQNMERRTLKQPNLRSKLKKMGLLPVANFEDDSH